MFFLKLQSLLCIVMHHIYPYLESKGLSCINNYHTSNINVSHIRIFHSKRRRTHLYEVPWFFIIFIFLIMTIIDTSCLSIVFPSGQSSGQIICKFPKPEFLGIHFGIRDSLTFHHHFGGWPRLRSTWHHPSLHRASRLLPGAGRCFFHQTFDQFLLNGKGLWIICLNKKWREKSKLLWRDASIGDHTTWMFYITWDASVNFLPIKSALFQWTHQPLAKLQLVVVEVVTKEWHRLESGHQFSWLIYNCSLPKHYPPEV